MDSISKLSDSLKIRQISPEKTLLALDALSKISNQFANKPAFIPLVQTLLLTLSGQFSTPNVFSILQNPKESITNHVCFKLGKYSLNDTFDKIIFNNDYEKHFLDNQSSILLDDLEKSGNCLQYIDLFRHNDVKVISPLVFNNNLLGIIGLGNRVTGFPFDYKDIDILDTLMHVIVPLIASSYQFSRIRDLNSWYMKILDNVRQGVLAFDSSNRLKMMNNMALTILNKHYSKSISIDSEINNTIDNIFPDEFFKGWSKKFVGELSKKQSSSIEGLTVLPNNKSHIYDIYLSKIGDNSETKSDYIITLEDVTKSIYAVMQKEELINKLEKSKRMESLGVLAGGVAHDLNNMLGPLVGYPELILTKLKDNSPIRKQVEKIGKAARSAADVVQDLLALARRGRYNMIPLNINDVIRDYIDSISFNKKCESKTNVKLTINLNHDLTNIMGSTSHLSKVIMNLIVNAFDAMPDGGILDISTSFKNCDHLSLGNHEIEQGEYVILSVKDTGMGIAKEDLSRIFEPYYSKKKMESSGSGLGLAVVYGIIKDHNGYYDVKSELGKGTEFILYFPKTNNEIEKSSQDTLTDSGTETILVVDDDDSQREITVDMLTNFGYKVFTACNGHESLRIIKENPVDIVLMDMIMEDNFDGLDAFKEIKIIYPNQKALILSGFTATERVEKMQKMGAGAFIKKPFTLNEIGSAIRDELDKVPTR